MKAYSILMMFFFMFLILSCEKEDNDELVYSMDVSPGSIWFDLSEYGIGDYRIETKSVDGEEETDIVSIVMELTGDRKVQGIVNIDGELLVFENEEYLLYEPILFIFTCNGKVEIFKNK